MTYRNFLIGELVELQMAVAIVASLLLISATCLSSQLLRTLTVKTLKDSLSKLLLLEFIASAELCAVCFELIVGNSFQVLGHY